jgi:hypothetical protein
LPSRRKRAATITDDDENALVVDDQSLDGLGLDDLEVLSEHSSAGKASGAAGGSGKSTKGSKGGASQNDDGKSELPSSVMKREKQSSKKSLAWMVKFKQGEDNSSNSNGLRKAMSADEEGARPSLSRNGASYHGSFRILGDLKRKDELDAKARRMKALRQLLKGGGMRRGVCKKPEKGTLDDGTLPYTPTDSPAARFAAGAFQDAHNRSPVRSPGNFSSPASPSSSSSASTPPSSAISSSFPSLSGSPPDAMKWAGHEGKVGHNKTPKNARRSWASSSPSSAAAASPTLPPHHPRQPQTLTPAHDVLQSDGKMLQVKVPKGGWLVALVTPPKTTKGLRVGGNFLRAASAKASGGSGSGGRLGGVASKRAPALHISCSAETAATNVTRVSGGDAADLEDVFEGSVSYSDGAEMLTSAAPGGHSRYAVQMNTILEDLSKKTHVFQLTVDRAKLKGKGTNDASGQGAQPRTKPNARRMSEHWEDGSLGRHEDVRTHLVKASAADAQLMKETLLKIPLLAHVGPDQLERLAAEVAVAEYACGEYVLTQGGKVDEQSNFFIIETGRARILVDGKFICHRNETEFFGEKGLIEDAPRNADVVADSETLRCLCVSRKAFNECVLLNRQSRATIRTRLAKITTSIRHMQPAGAGRSSRLRATSSSFDEHDIDDDDSDSDSDSDDSIGEVGEFTRLVEGACTSGKKGSLSSSPVRKAISQNRTGALSPSPARASPTNPSNGLGGGTVEEDEGVDESEGLCDRLQRSIETFRWSNGSICIDRCFRALDAVRWMQVEVEGCDKFEDAMYKCNQLRCDGLVVRARRDFRGYPLHGAGLMCPIFQGQATVFACEDPQAEYDRRLDESGLATGSDGKEARGGQVLRQSSSGNSPMAANSGGKGTSKLGVNKSVRAIRGCAAGGIATGIAGGNEVRKGIGGMMMKGQKLIMVGSAADDADRDDVFHFVNPPMQRISPVVSAAARNGSNASPSKWPTGLNRSSSSSSNSSSPRTRATSTGSSDGGLPGANVGRGVGQTELPLARAQSAASEDDNPPAPDASTAGRGGGWATRLVLAGCYCLLLFPLRVLLSLLLSLLACCSGPSSEARNAHRRRIWAPLLESGHHVGTDASPCSAATSGSPWSAVQHQLRHALAVGQSALRDAVVGAEVGLTGFWERVPSNLERRHRWVCMMQQRGKFEKVA